MTAMSKLESVCTLIVSDRICETATIYFSTLATSAGKGPSRAPQWKPANETRPRLSEGLFNKLKNEQASLAKKTWCGLLSVVTAASCFCVQR